MEIDYREFEFLASTQKWAKKHLSQLHPQKLTVVSAKSQTEGYGRSNHSWVSPPGNLYLSFVFFTSPRSFLHRTTQWLSLITCEWLQTHSLTASIKWPNDLLVQGKKIGGALTEIHDDSVIAGLGINVKRHPSHLASTSLEMETKLSFNLADLTYSLAETVSSSLPQFLSEGFHPFQARFEKKIVHKLQDKIRFKEQSKEIEGIFLGFDQDGAILLKNEEGTVFSSFNGIIE